MPGINPGVKNDCAAVPSLVSAFVDTFVDFTVGGQFLGPSLHNTTTKNVSSTDLHHHEASKPPAGVEDGKARSFIGGIAADEKQQQQQQDGPVLTTRLPAAERLVAVGDLHGDLAKAKEALRIARVMDEDNKWIGGDTVVVQVGDVLDRGGEEIKIMYLLEKLKAEARRDGGDVHIMNGNHEIMNMEGDFRCVTAEGMEEFQRWAHWHKMGNALKERCVGLGKPYDFFKGIPEKLSDGMKARLAALRPGGPLSSRFFASHPTVLVVGGTVFVHGGLLPTHIDHGLEEINSETRQWMQGKKGFFGPKYLHGKDALVWVRKYSNQQESACDCEVLEKALNAVSGAKRMVVGHTIQDALGINAVCSNKVVRVDVGMSEGCGNGTPEVLEIRNDKVLTVLSASASLKMMDVEDMSAYLKRQQVDRPVGLASLLSRKSPEAKAPA